MLRWPPPEEGSLHDETRGSWEQETLEKDHCLLSCHQPCSGKQDSPHPALTHFHGEGQAEKRCEPASSTYWWTPVLL
jgi:hypothetical protein